MSYSDGVNVSKKDWFIALLLVIFGGGIGLHRFYCKKIGTGVLYLFTFGLFGIGYIVDAILVVMKIKMGRLFAIVMF